MADADEFYYYRKSGQQQIPAFGDWETVNELPITQYFECARQAGLLRCSCSSCAASAGLDATNYHKPQTLAAPLRKKTRGGGGGMNKSCQHSKEQVKVDHQPQETQKHNPNDYRGNKSNVQFSVKPVDEDLYKIPSELLQNSKRKRRMLGFFSRCMVPPCAA